MLWTIRMDVAVRELTESDLPNAIAVVARGMRDNPINVRAMGGNSASRLRKLNGLFAAALPALLRKGTVFGASLNGTLVGVLGMAPPGTCRASALDKTLLAPRLLAAIGPTSLIRTARWQAIWESHDPDTPHWHLGPVAADANMQGRGIGSSMMKVYCARLDRDRAAGYLETDKEENLGFYKKFGFEVVGEAPVLNVRNWFMHRLPR